MHYSLVKQCTCSVNKSDIRTRLGALVFLSVMTIQGMPIGRDISESVERFADERFQMALESSTTIGIQNTYSVAIIWGIFYLLSLTTIVRNAQLSFVHALRRQWPITALTLFIPLSMVWSVYPVPVAMNAIHALGALLIAFAASLYYWDKSTNLIRHLALVLGINVAIHVTSVFILPLFAISFDGRWQGLTTNANTLGAIAALSIWANGVAILTKTGRMILNWSLLLPSILALYGSGSVTAALCAVIAMTIAIMIKIYRPLAINAVLILVIATFFAFVFGNFVIDFILEQILPMLGRTSDLSGRMDHWSDAVNLIASRPILGWGFDNNAHVIELTRLSTIHFHNGYLDLTVRGGILALILGLSALLISLHYMERADRQFQIAAFSFMAFMLVHNISEVSLMVARNGIWMIFLLLAFSAIPRNGNFIR